MNLSFSSLAEMSNEDLLEIADQYESKSIEDFRTIIEEQILRQLQDIAAAMLADMLFATEYDNFASDEFDVYSRHVVNIISQQLYREHEGKMSDAVVQSLRYSIADQESVDKLADILL